MYERASTLQMEDRQHTMQASTFPTCVLQRHHSLRAHLWSNGSSLLVAYLAASSACASCSLICGASCSNAL
jgi:hypothetical protein